MTEENKTYRLGELIELCDERNTAGKYTLADVKGMTITKELIPTKANIIETDLSKFLIVRPNDFVYNPRTHGKHIGLGFNDTKENFIISWNNTAFRIKPSMKETILPEYLFMNVSRDEWDREACYQAWGTSTEVFTWDALCDMKLTLPPLAAQKKAVAVYRALKENLAVYEHGLQDLKLVCDGFIDRIKNGSPEIKDVAHFCLGDLVEEVDERNTAGKYTLADVKGISTEKKFIDTKADMNGVSLQSYKIVKPDEFAYVADTSRRGDKIALAYNDGGNSLLISSIYTTFRVSRPDVILSEYLSLFFSRAEFDRYARYCSWGSARETFDWNELCDVQIPVPPLGVQQSIVNIYKCYIERLRIAAELKAQIKAACPVLVKGSLEWE